MPPVLAYVLLQVELRVFLTLAPDGAE